MSVRLLSGEVAVVSLVETLVHCEILLFGEDFDSRRVVFEPFQHRLLPLQPEGPPHCGAADHAAPRELFLGLLHPAS